MCHECYRIDQAIDNTFKCSGNYSRAGVEEASRLESKKPQCLLHCLEQCLYINMLLLAFSFWPAIIMAVICGALRAPRAISVIILSAVLALFVVFVVTTIAVGFLKSTSYYKPG